MKQSKIINAYKDMEQLATISSLTDQEQWQLYKLRKILRPHHEFQQERENAILEKYKPYADENGNIKGDILNEYIQEMNDLNNMDVELEDFEKPSIPNRNINFLLMEKLEDFINFIEA